MEDETVIDFRGRDRYEVVTSRGALVVIGLEEVKGRFFFGKFRSRVRILDTL